MRVPGLVQRDVTKGIIHAFQVYSAEHGLRHLAGHRNRAGSGGFAAIQTVAPSFGVELTPVAQIRAGPIQALGSHLG